MPTAPYPLHPEPMSRSWLERHPLLKVPLGCLSLIALIVIVVAAALAITEISFHSSRPYKQAFARTARDPQVRQLMGEPIRAAWFTAGHLNSGAITGTADFTIPISGPRGKGRIRVVALKDYFWKLTCLQVYIDGQPQPIDLLSTQPLLRDF